MVEMDRIVSRKRGWVTQELSEYAGAMLSGGNGNALSQYQDTFYFAIPKLNYNVKIIS
jgi:hypothetical protein